MQLQQAKTDHVFFKGIEQKPVEFRGMKAKLPVFYQDAVMMSAVFTADLEKAKEWLKPLKGFAPLSLFPGRALVGIASMEYKTVDIGTYNEFAISIGVARGEGARPRPLQVLKSVLKQDYDCHIISLPVTTEIAWHGGVDLYGYPKILGDITFTETDTKRICTFKDKETGEVIFVFSGDKIPVAEYGQNARERSDLNLLAMNSYALLGEKPLLARFLLNQKRSATKFFGRHASIEYGPSPKSKILKDLDLGMEIQYSYSPQLEGILETPKFL